MSKKFTIRPLEGGETNNIRIIFSGVLFNLSMLKVEDGSVVIELPCDLSLKEKGFCLDVDMEENGRRTNIPIFAGH